MLMSAELLFSDDQDVAANCKRFNENESEKSERKAKQVRMKTREKSKNTS